MTQAFISGVTFKRHNGDSPETYTAIEEVKTFSGLGQTNPLVDATSFQSTAREYIGGLADGDEITVECLRVHTSPSYQDKLTADVVAKTNRLFQVVVTDGTTTYTYGFTGTCLKWGLVTSFDDANMIQYTIKISGGISETVS